MTVQDDGTGFEMGSQPGMASGHFGMQGMRERVERLGGTCDVTSTRGAGTTVTARVPPPRGDRRPQTDPRAMSHDPGGGDMLKQDAADMSRLG